MKTEILKQINNNPGNSAQPALSKPILIRARKLMESPNSPSLDHDAVRGISDENRKQEREPEKLGVYRARYLKPDSLTNKIEETYVQRLHRSWWYIKGYSKLYRWARLVQILDVFERVEDPDWIYPVYGPEAAVERYERMVGHMRRGWIARRKGIEARYERERLAFEVKRNATKSDEFLASVDETLAESERVFGSGGCPDEIGKEQIFQLPAHTYQTGEFGQVSDALLKLARIFPGHRIRFVPKSGSSIRVRHNGVDVYCDTVEDTIKLMEAIRLNGS